MDIAEALMSLDPDSYKVNGDTYDGIVWPDGIVKFSETAVMAEVDRLEQVKIRAREIAEAKEIRDSSLQGLTHVFSDGRAVQVRPQDEQPINAALDIMSRNGINSYAWFDVNDEWITVSVSDLQEMKISGQDQAAEVWSRFKALTTVAST